MQVIYMVYLWGGMLLIGIVYGVLAGNVDEVTKAFVSCSGEAVSLCISMAGITAMWTGMMKIAENSGLVTELAAKMRPLIRFLFPKLDTESKAAHYICLNFLSNVLGLSWASTSSGLCAMKELKELQLQKENAEKNTEDSGKKDAVKNSSMIASNEMCTFLIINVSSLQLIPVNMIAYRAKYGSADPTAIVGPAILATAVSTAVAVIFCRIAGKYKKVSP
jgi:spore maturation protein A